MTALAQSPGFPETYLPPHGGENSRGLTLALGAVTSIVLGFGADYVATQKLWPHRATEIIGTDSPFVAYPGLSNDSGAFIADGLRDTLGQIDYIQYSPRHFTTDAIAEAQQARDAATRSELSKNIIAVSMGFPTWYMGERALLDRGAQPKPVQNLLLISSPVSAQDAHMRNAVRVLAHSGIRGGTISKGALEFASSVYFERHRLRSMGRCATEAMRNSVSGFSPRLWTGQVKLLAAADNPDKQYVPGVVTEETTITQVIDPEDDVVSMERSVASLERFSARHGATLRVIEAPGLGHANIDSRIYPFKRKISEALFAVSR